MASINKITGSHRCARPVRQLAPVNMPPMGQTSNICTKLTHAQVGCVTNVDSCNLYACTYVAGVRDISKIVCYRQVIFAAVTKLQQFEEKTTTIFLLQGFTKCHVYSTAQVRIQPYVTGKLPVYTVCSQFKH